MHLPLRSSPALLLLVLLLPACAGGTASDKPGDTGETDVGGETGDSADSAGCEGTTEVPYDGVDNDCDASTPDDDLDGDGLVRADDCDDTNEALGGAEVPYDGVDNDCDGATPDDDLDGDGVLSATDCEDDNAAVHPGAPELCNQLDDDCDGLIDAADPDLNVLPVWYADDDSDGYGNSRDHLAACEAPPGYVAADTDCDDTDSDVNPDALEVCDDLDNDCDGLVDGADDDATGAVVYEDRDGDGHGTSASTREGCGTGDGWSNVDDDCNDADATVHPGADELCDEVDNNCDATIDEGTPVDAPTWYADTDTDTYGDPATTQRACEQPAGYVSNNDDCDDTDPAVIDEGCASVGGYGGHRIDRDGQYYYALYNDDGVGIMGSRDWYGSSDAASGPEGVAWSPDQTVLYYNDLGGNVFALSDPFGSTSTRVGAFTLGQVGGGVVDDTSYYVGDYTYGNIYAMDLASGSTALYSSLGGSACKPYFGNSAMSIDSDGTVYAASSCGIVQYPPGGTAVQLNMYSNLLSAVAMDASQELYGIDSSGNIVHFDKATGAELGRIRISVTPSVTWTMAVDGNGDFVVNYWGEQYVFSHVDGSPVTMFSASSYYPGTSGYYWYVTF